MNAFAGIGYRARSKKPFWKHNGFWFVVLPTGLVGIVFVVGMIATALGH
jgi:hypothetical protein